MMPTRNAGPSPVPANENSSNVGFSGDFQDLCSFGMDQALGIEQVSLAALARLNSCALDIYQNVLWSNPVFGTFLDISSQALAFSLEMQMNWLTMLSPYAWAQVSTVTDKRGPDATELERSMDIATGERFTPASTVTNISDGRPRTEAPERNPHIAAMARAV
jgi:hypothetical protein